MKVYEKRLKKIQPNFFICKLNWKFIWSFWGNDKEFYKFYSIFEKSKFIFIGKISRSIDFSSLSYVFALSFFETLHSINNLAVTHFKLSIPSNTIEKWKTVDKKLMSFGWKLSDKLLVQSNDLWIFMSQNVFSDVWKG